ncbi:ras-related protein Rab-7a-like isoform X2 [Pseudophryne corroboree]
MNQYVSSRFTNHYRATIGADFFTKELRVDDKLAIVQIWDTAGTERFQSLGAALYRCTDCCILVFDVTSPTSFEALDTWHKEFLIQADPLNPEKFPFVVIANKTDLEERQVLPRQALAWCKTCNAEYYETSAKEAMNVEEAFLGAIKLALKYHEEPGQNFDGDSVTLLEKEDRKKQKCEC